MTDISEVDHILIAQQNDAFRCSFGQSSTIKGRVVMTPGVANIDDLGVMQIQAAIAEFNDFNENNDPYEDHSFGVVKVMIDGVETTFWFKIDLYDLTYNYGSDKPDDPVQTRRVMTILLPSEY